MTSGLVVAAFGPYLPIPGIRVEQAAVYTALIAAVVLCGWARRGTTLTGTVVVALLATEATIAGIGAVDSVYNTSGFLGGAALAGMDNLLLPVAVTATTWMAVRGDTTKALRAACLTLVICCCANAMIAFASITADLTDILGPFWDNTIGVESVAERAAALGRYSGIFNQPAEAGQMYSIALLAAIWLWPTRPSRLAVALPLLVVGGTLTVSKVFLFVGMPVAIWQILRTTRGRGRRLAAIGCATAAATASSYAGLLPEWAGADWALRLAHPDATSYGLIHLYTAGRFGSESTLVPVLTAILDSSPWFGFGAGGLAIAYDNAWIEALAVAGLAGAAIYTTVLVALLGAWLRRRRIVDRAEAQFAGGLLIVIVATSAGLPALTANRVATVTWLLLTLLLLLPSVAPDRAVSDRAVTRGRHHADRRGREARCRSRQVSTRSSSPSRPSRPKA